MRVNGLGRSASRRIALTGAAASDRRDTSASRAASLLCAAIPSWISNAAPASPISSMNATSILKADIIRLVAALLQGCHPLLIQSEVAEPIARMRLDAADLVTRAQPPPWVLAHPGGLAALRTCRSGGRTSSPGCGAVAALVFAA